MIKKPLTEFRPEYGKSVPVSVDAWVNYAFDMGNHYERHIVRESSPDAFEYVSDTSDSDSSVFVSLLGGENKKYAVVEDRSGFGFSRPSPAERYYKIAFCNYWKSGIEELLEKKEEKATAEQIKSEMKSSLVSLAKIEDLLVENGAKGVNLITEFKNGKLTNSAQNNGVISYDEYTQMFINTFLNGKQYRLDCFSYGIKESNYAAKTVVNDNTVRLLFGDMFTTGMAGDIVLDNAPVANAKYHNILEEAKKTYPEFYRADQVAWREA